MLQKEKMIWVVISLCLVKLWPKRNPGLRAEVMCSGWTGKVKGKLQSLNGNGYFRQEPQWERLLPSRASMGAVTSVKSRRGSGYLRQEPQWERLLPSSEGLLSARLGFPHGSTGNTSYNPNSDSVKEDLPSPLAWWGNWHRNGEWLIKVTQKVAEVRFKLRSIWVQKPALSTTPCDHGLKSLKQSYDYAFGCQWLVN